jgi:hypothetical protein
MRLFIADGLIDWWRAEPKGIFCLADHRNQPNHLVWAEAISENSLIGQKYVFSANKQGELHKYVYKKRRVGQPCVVRVGICREKEKNVGLNLP